MNKSNNDVRILGGETINIFTFCVLFFFINVIFLSFLEVPSLKKIVFQYSNNHDNICVNSLGLPISIEKIEEISSKLSPTFNNKKIILVENNCPFAYDKEKSVSVSVKISFLEYIVEFLRK